MQAGRPLRTLPCNLWVRKMQGFCLPNGGYGQARTPPPPGDNFPSTERQLADPTNPYFVRHRKTHRDGICPPMENDQGVVGLDFAYVELAAGQQSRALEERQQ